MKMSRGDQHEYLHEAEQEDGELEAARASVSPGKLTLTMRLARQMERAAPGHPAPVQAFGANQRSSLTPRSASPADLRWRREAEMFRPGSGQEMPGAVRAKMEAAFGMDFSAVRIHEGPLASAIGALAFAQGTDVHFAPGQYQPYSQRGQEILGHELAHVVQQAEGRARATQAKGINDDAALEREADVLGARAARGEQVRRGRDTALIGRSAAHGPGLPIQRKMGVELEVGSLVILEKPTMAGKGTTIAGDESQFYKLVVEATSSGAWVVEFVTEPAADTGEQLLAGVKKMAEWAALLDKPLSPRKSQAVEQGNTRHWPGNRDPRTDQEREAQAAQLESLRSKRRADKVTVIRDGKVVTTDESKDEKGAAEFVIARAGNVEGALQVSVGVTLGDVPALYNKFPYAGTGSGGQTRWNDLMSNPESKESICPDGTPFSKLDGATRGFILLVMDYIARGATPEKRPFVKAKFDILARTDFQHIFASLPAKEQERLSQAAPDEKRPESEEKVRSVETRYMKKEWVDWIIEKTFQTEQHPHPKRATASTPSPGGDKQLVAMLDGRSSQALTREAWLTNMPNEDGLTTKKLGDRALGLGAYGGKMDQHAETKEAAPIFELRAPLGASIPYTSWEAKVRELWNIYAPLIGRGTVEAKEEKGAAPAVDAPAPKGCCFITTACVTARGLPDDCEELTVLRSFRDGYLLRKEGGDRLVGAYYAVAPAIVAAIEREEDAPRIYDHLYDVIRVCVDAIKRGDHEQAFETYCQMVVTLAEAYLPDAPARPDHSAGFTSAARR